MKRGIAFFCLIVAAGITAAQTREEYDALMKVVQEPSVDTRIQLGEEFLQKHSQSTYAATVHQQLVYAYSQKNNPDKVIEHGELATSVKDATMLTSLANAYNDKKNDAKAVEKAQAAIELLGGGWKPDNAAPDQWQPQKNNLLSFNHYVLGSAFTRQAKPLSATEKNNLLGKAQDALQTAANENPKNDIAYYQLGLTLAEMSQGTAACEALAKAVALEGPAKPYAQQDLEKIYVHYNKSKRGLDKLLAKAKAEMPK